MEIRIAKTAGFCFGVERAVNMAFSYQNEADTYTYGPIIHNEVVTKSLEDKGIYVLDQLEGQEIKHLIIRSHGVCPEIYEKGREKGIEIIDATCPYVKKIHHYVQQYNDKGYHIIVAGNVAHPEVQGINGWAQNKCLIASDVEELKAMTLPEGNYLLVAQTTYKEEVVDEMRAYLQSKQIPFEYINTICNATKERQEEAASLAKEVDCMLILGSPQSANTRKLYEISQTYCPQSYCISGASELKEIHIADCKCIGITAGASTPKSVIEEVVTYLQKFEK